MWLPNHRQLQRGKELKRLIITYSNGDVEQSVYCENTNQMLDSLIEGSFKTAWHFKDEKGNYKLVTNMTHVRSIEIEEFEDEVED